MGTESELGKPLKSGSRLDATLRGTVVLRKASAWTPTVHALLSHLESEGFEGAPRVIGSGFDAQGRETLTYIEGECIHPQPWTENALITIGQMIRELHHATASFQVPPSAVWRPWFGRGLGSSRQIIGHCDATPWNIISRAGQPIALIDWETAGPVDPLTELAQVCWTNAQLYDDDVAAKIGLPDADIRVQQVRLMANAYELPASGRRELAGRILEFAAQEAANEVIEANVTEESTDPAPLWAIAWRTRSVAWILRHRAMLEGALD